jgi:hypothetical protein
MSYTEGFIDALETAAKLAEALPHQSLPATYRDMAASLAAARTRYPRLTLERTLRPPAETPPGPSTP